MAAVGRAGEIVNRAWGETVLRWQMANAFVNKKMSGEGRVNVVFCRFRQLTMRSPLQPEGATFSSPRPLIWLGRILWPYTFIVVNVTGQIVFPRPPASGRGPRDRTRRWGETSSSGHHGL